MNIMKIEPTPNPNALKFIMDLPILEFGSRSYMNRAAAANDPLASRILAIPDVESVFYMSDFITVSKTNQGNWDTLVDQIRSTVTGLTPAGEAAQTADGKVTDAAATGEDALLFERITEVIDRKVRPALAADGGGLELLGLNDYTLRVRYHGACGSCPSSTAGTLRAIGNLLQNEVDNRLVVIPG